MTDTRPMMIYLAGPIDDIPIEEARHWRAMAGHELPTGIVLFSPAHAYQGEVNKITAPKVDFFNRVNIVHSDGVIANLAGEGRGFGTIREIEFARTHNKPTAVIATHDQPVLSLLAHDLFLVESFDEALQEIMVAVMQDRNTPRGVFLQLPFQQADEE